MKKTAPEFDKDEIRPEYDFRTGVRGKYSRQYKDG
jgi:hypothetical protein